MYEMHITSNTKEHHCVFEESLSKLCFLMISQNSEQMTVLKMCSVVDVVSIAVCKFYHHWLAVAIA